MVLDGDDSDENSLGRNIRTYIFGVTDLGPPVLAGSVYPRP